MYALIEKFKAALPVSTKARVQYLLGRFSDEELNRYQDKQKVLVALAADYGNLGDVAITSAQEAFLRSCLPGHEIIDFPISSTFTRMKALKRVMTSDDIVTIVGGGNMGDLHSTIEDCRRFVIEKFHRNRVVSFPQTIDFSRSPVGRRELRKTAEIYRKHRDLHLFARESVSYELMKKVFPCNYVHLVPDIVLSLDRAEPTRERQGVMLCMRNDNESAFSAKERSTFLCRIFAALPDHLEIDTHLGRDGLGIQEREEGFTKILDSFKKARVVITDRLHGMIFAVITCTPCVVLQNNNHKIKSTYETWLRPLGHIRLQETVDAEETLRRVEELRSLDQAHKQMPGLTPDFEILRRAVVGQ
jgi:pyruvyl transferase EpsI